MLQGHKRQKAYLVTQTPLTDTAVDMWRMLSDHKSYSIVMLDPPGLTKEMVSYSCLGALLYSLKRLTLKSYLYQKIPKGHTDNLLP